MNAKSKNAASKAIHGSSANGMWIVLGVLAAVIILVVGGFFIATKVFGVGKRDAVTVDFAQTADAQLKIDEQGAITAGKDGAPKIDMYEDFMCPACGSFEHTYGEQIREAVNNGELQIVNHYLNFLNPQSGSGEYSTRAIAAIQCVATKDSLDTYLQVREAFFTGQPHEGGGDLTAKDLGKLAKDAGASDESVACIEGVEGEGGQNMDKANSTGENSQKHMTDSGLQPSTPSVAQDGEQVNTQDPAWLDKIISAGGQQ